MHAIEFYTTPSGEVIIKEQGQPERQLKESDTDFIQRFLEVLEEFYPEAYTALRKYYARYDGNKCYRDFLAVRRFIKCNFGLYDNMIDIDENWNFKFEFVGCPLRGECDGLQEICGTEVQTVHFQTVNFGQWSFATMARKTKRLRKRFLYRPTP